VLEAGAVVTDPWFWAVAVPAVLLTGLSKSGFASGLGTLATPMIALTVPVPQAAAIMLPLLMAMDATGLQQLWRQRDPALLRALLPGGLLGVAIGMLCFGLLSTKAVSGIVGGLTLAFLAHRLLLARPPAAGAAPSRWLGQACAVISGFTSFIIHAGGPPINAYLLPMRLQPIVLAGTLSVYFAAINAAKVLPYAALGLIDLRNLATAALLLPLAPLGVRVGVRLTRHVSPTWFYRVAYGCMAASGAKLLWDGLKP
jgi:uncharacterized membrane protein YfcA